MTLEAWIGRQYRHAAEAMLRSVSPTGIVKTRPGFGQTMRPRPGAVVASPILGDWNPEPDYFFHWFRDAAIVVDALRLLHQDARESNAQGLETPDAPAVDAMAAFAAFVRFNLSLRALDGRDLVASPSWRAGVAADHDRYTRTDDDLAGAHGAAILAETRVNPDGTLDISKWGRPQHDGPALTALTLLRWSRSGTPFDAALEADCATLLRDQLAFTLDRWAMPCLDLWEEEQGHHYYTLRVQAGALEEGAAWLIERGDIELAARCRDIAEKILRRLDGFWCEDEGIYESRERQGGARSDKACDSAVILAAIHAGAFAGPHSMADERMHRTLRRLEAIFAAAFAINVRRGAEAAPALGRYPGDVYQSGGAWYLATLAAAELCYGAALAAEPGRAGALLARGDAYLATVRAFTPSSGDLAEQIDPLSGEPRSTRHLAWSYAAFISCTAARRLLVDDRAGPA